MAIKTLPCNHCGLPIQIPEEYAHVKSVEHNVCPAERSEVLRDKEEKKG